MAVISIRPLLALFVALFVALFAASTDAAGDTYLIGAGKADITGPTVELPFSGYAMLTQKGSGVRQRLYTRAFIIGDAQGNDRFAYLILDVAFGDTAIRRGIIEGMAALGGDYAKYTDTNVAVVGTHSHSGPGGWNNYLLPLIPTLGFNQQNFNAIVQGGILALKRAHDSLTQGTIDVGTTDIQDGNINRSLWSYMNNPQAEQDKYGSSTDKTMTLMRLKRKDGKILGLINWYAVHGTSAYNNNTLVTGDNKGVAAYLFERDMANDPSAAPGFVAGFSQANVGDVSPNVLGQWCEDGSGQQCDLKTSQCPDGSSVNCHGRGPVFTANDNGISSCYEIGRRQYAAAKSIMVSAMPPPRSPTELARWLWHSHYWSYSQILPLLARHAVLSVPGTKRNNRSDLSRCYGPRLRLWYHRRPWGKGLRQWWRWIGWQSNLGLGRQCRYFTRSTSDS